MKIMKIIKYKKLLIVICLSILTSCTTVKKSKEYINLKKRLNETQEENNNLINLNNSIKTEYDNYLNTSKGKLAKINKGLNKDNKELSQSNRENLRNIDKLKRKIEELKKDKTKLEKSLAISSRRVQVLANYAVYLEPIEKKIKNDGWEKVTISKVQKLKISEYSEKEVVYVKFHSGLSSFEGWYELGYMTMPHRIRHTTFAKYSGLGVTIIDEYGDEVRLDSCYECKSR